MLMSFCLLLFSKFFNKNKKHSIHLLHIRREIVYIVKYVIRDTSILASVESDLFQSRFNIQNVHEDVHASFSYVCDKKHIYLALNKKSNEQIMIEVLHMLAHLVHLNVGHREHFWNIRARLVSGYVKMNANFDQQMISAFVIQRAWKICVSNPYYIICRRRLLWEYDQMQYNNYVFNQ